MSFNGEKNGTRDSDRHGLFLFCLFVYYTATTTTTTISYVYSFAKRTALSTADLV